MERSPHSRIPRLVAAMLICTLLSVAARPSGVLRSASGQDGVARPLDLAAMAFTPADLEQAGLAGYGIGVSVLGDPDAAAQFLTTWRDDPDGALTNGVVAAGPVRVHMLLLGLPFDPDDPDSSTIATVFTYVFEFPDAAAATSGFQQLSAGWLTGNAQTQATTSTVGQDRQFFREAGIDPGAGTAYDRADLLFTFDRLVLGVSLEDISGVPDEAVLDTLARRLQAHALLGLVRRTPGLSNQIVRIASSAGPDPWEVDRYGALGGTVLKHRSDSSQDHLDRQAIHDQFGIIDYYFVNQPLGSLAADADAVYSNGLRTFVSTAQVEAYQADALERLVERGATNLQEIPDPPALGDATALHSYQIEVDGQTMAYWRADIRVGTTLATFFLRGATLPTRAAVEEIVRAQAQCLAQVVCLEPIPLPQALA